MRGRSERLIGIDTKGEKDKFIDDASKLTAVVVSEDGAMSHVADLLNIWGVFIPSNEVGPLPLRAWFDPGG